MTTDQLLKEAQKAIEHISDPVQKAKMLLTLYEYKTRNKSFDDMRAGSSEVSNEATETPVSCPDSTTQAKEVELIRDFARVINRNSLESESDTPDYILAEYVVGMLNVANRLINARKAYYAPISGRLDSAILSDRAAFDVADAVRFLADKLYKDKDFYQSWQSNIAVAIQDVWKKRGGGDNSVTNLMSNEAAKNFLDTLIG